MTLRLPPLARQSLHVATALLALYGAIHLGCIALDAIHGRPALSAARSQRIPEGRQPLASAVTRILAEDGVEDPARWAGAIVRASPVDHLGYVALVLAQIQRESKFLAPDLEWLYDRLVPERLHELGLDDPVRTLGPMQVQRHALLQRFRQAHDRPLTWRDVKELAATPESGVAACIEVLDPIVVDFSPDRRLEGWMTRQGPLGLFATDTTTSETIPARNACHQKMLSDLTGEPLALDGILASHTLRVARHAFAVWDADVVESLRPALDHVIAQPASQRTFVDSPLEAAIDQAWTARWGTPPTAIDPRIAHDPRVAFIVADFHVGRGACRTAALQSMLPSVTGSALDADGLLGPQTRHAMEQLFEACVDDGARRVDFLRLLREGRKRTWVRDQAFQLASRAWRAREGRSAPSHRIPDLTHDGWRHRLKGLGSVCVRSYVSGSVAAYEEYLVRLHRYTGREVTPGIRTGSEPPATR